MALLANIKLGCKDLSVTNTLGFYEHLLIMVVKSFITLGPGIPLLYS
jgi:hypothetical protein